MKNPFSTRSEMGIRKRVFFLLVVVFVPLLFIQAFTFYRWYQESKKAEMQANLELARTVSKSFEEFINDVLHTQFAIGLEAAASPHPSHDSLRRILKAMEQANPMLRSFTWSSPAGVSLVTTNPAIENLEIRAPTLVSKIVSGEEYDVSDLHDSPDTGEKVFMISRGIRDPEGNLLGIMDCVCVADKLGPLLAVKRSKDTAVGLIDSKGILVYRYPSIKYAPVGLNRLERQPVIQRALDGKEAVAEVHGPRDEIRLAALVPIPSIGWVAASSRAKNEVVENLVQTLLPHAVFMLFVTLAAFGAAVTLSRPISTSIRSLRDHAAALGQGEAKRFETVHGPHEIKNLFEAFNDMAERVRSREDALRESEQRFRAIFENSREAVFLTSPDGSIAAANPAACTMLGYSEDEICRLGRSGVLDPDDPRLSDAMEERRRTGHVQGRELTGIRRSGERFPVEVDSVILPAQPHLSFVIMREITERKQAEEALRASERRFRELITNMLEVLFTLDRNGRINFVSPSVESMTQYRDSEIIGHHISEFIFKDDLPRLYQNIQKFMSGTGNAENEYRMVTKNGEIRWMRTSSTLLYEGEEIMGVQGILSDITERKRVEEALRDSEEKFRLLVETTSDWIWETDADGTYTYASPRVRDLLGYEPEEVVGRKPFEFMPPEESARIIPEFSRATKERKPFFGLENVNIGRDGRRVVLETSGLPRLDAQGNLLGYRGIDRDITDRKRAEEALQRSHDELELRVMERTAELERRNRELQHFTFAASHDLQEPMRKIQIFSDLIATRYSDAVSEEGRVYIKRMHETATRMRDVLQSLMKYSRLTSKNEVFGRVDLNEIAREAVSDLEIQIRDTGAEVEIWNLPEIEADAGQMRQLFLNLIGNALKFSREGIKPKVKIHADCSQENRECEIFISDNGIGFEEKFLESIFKPFHRLQGKDKYGGVGMGLAICSKVVEHHRGKITARSTPGKGSTFVVTLPLDAGEREVRGGNRSGSDSSLGKVIMF